MLSQCSGRIHSLDTMSTLDGPGIRTMVYFQGCPLKCHYCHNRDTWNPQEGTLMSMESLVEFIKRYESFYKTSSGGVTFSGGEPLLQGNFLLSLIKECKSLGIHTAIETSGYGLLKTDSELATKLISLVDLVILDVKDVTQRSHELPTFIKALKNVKKHIWLRYVQVPGESDCADYRNQVEIYSRQFMEIEKIEPLPYHELGLHKWLSQAD
jgi:pyruvate formate lyase activating enzyme